MIDTSAHETQLIRGNLPFGEEHCHNYAMHDASGIIEAARDFLLDAQNRGVAIFYVSNRLQTEEEPLRATLTRLGVPLTSDNVLVRGAPEEWNVRTRGFISV